MSTLEPLCKYCSKTPLNDDSNTFPHRSWSLGPGSRIKCSNCRLCKLVVSVFQTLFQLGSWRNGEPLSKRSDVRLFWNSAKGPGGRFRFSLDPSTTAIHYIIKAATVTPPMPNQLTHLKYRYLRPTTTANFDAGRISDGMKQSIVEVQNIVQYVALSYVWGDVPSIRLTTANRSSFLLAGGIRKAWNSIPLTIRDASEHVRKLGVRYFWVDSLGLHLSLDQHLNRSTYVSRAWTFQEQHLVHRAVYIFEKQVFFRCREDTYAEKLVDHPARKGSTQLSRRSDSRFPKITHLDPPLSDFSDMISYYTPRALTNQSDILRALSGICRRVSDKAKCPFFEGIPVHVFEIFVVFRA
ncbi:hypothetical protein B0H63DRAFT_561555 [Podospora didyma]|uniref:Heterokaryon incompatibility domain-containing protein n=1 Tax=Podospora didyma TaxID=330526 RepID=A0AAE0TWE5_9PEZI|nr:hypothetical protein B0H63DRAFT_561555 [Podospora didyma]